MFEIRTVNSIAPIGLSRLSKSKYSVSDESEAPHGILVRSAKMHDYPFNPELLCIARAGAGTNNIPVDACAEKGIVVFNTPGANAMAVKELAVCALLLASRDITGGIEWVKTIADQGADIPALVEKGKKAFVGPELWGKNLGIIGLGAIGAKIANAGVDLGMNVYGYDPYLSVEGAWNLSSKVNHSTDVDEIFAKCDYISLHIPCIDATRYFINANSLVRMKKGVRILNLARGELVNDTDMAEALASGRVAKYVTDFPNETILRCSNVIAIPHLGASTPESEDNCAVMAAQEMADYLENGNIVNSVNMPRAVMPRNGDPRVCVIHKNIPDMIARITGGLGANGVNIENMVNAGLKNKPFAYTMLDLDHVPEHLVDSLYAIEGVVRVRVI